MSPLVRVRSDSYIILLVQVIRVRIHTVYIEISKYRSREPMPLLGSREFPKRLPRWCEYTFYDTSCIYLLGGIGLSLSLYKVVRKNKIKKFYIINGEKHPIKR